MELKKKKPIARVRVYSPPVFILSTSPPLVFGKGIEDILPTAKVLYAIFDTLFSKPSWSAKLVKTLFALAWLGCALTSWSG